MYGKTAQTGLFTPKNPSKYSGNVDNIVYRSSWEKRLMKHLDLHPDVLQWCSEEKGCIVPYQSPLDNKIHRYFIDFWVKLRTKEGNIEELLIEVKPRKFTQKPAPRKRKTKKYQQEMAQYATNLAKWDAAEKWAKRRGMKFVILTEETLLS